MAKFVGLIVEQPKPVEQNPTAPENKPVEPILTQEKPVQRTTQKKASSGRKTATTSNKKGT